MYVSPQIKKWFPRVFVFATTILAGCQSSTSANTPISATVFNSIQSMPGWVGCSACAGGGGKATLSMQQHESSPSLDGDSTRFSISGTVPYSHGLWSKHLMSGGAASTATNFVLDLYFQLDDPAASQAVEIAANQAYSHRWYKYSTQCNYHSHLWRVWDSAGARWVSTSAPCLTPVANTWQHVVWQFARQNGRAVFVAVTVNDQTYYINQSFNPRPVSYSDSVGVHFQIDGNKYEQSYSAWVDEMNLAIW